MSSTGSQPTNARERFGRVPRVDGDARHPRRDFRDLREHAVEFALVLCEPHLQVVDLLYDAPVVCVGQRVGDFTEHRERAADALRLVLDLFEYALDLARHRLADHPVHAGAAGDLALGADLRPREFEVLDLVDHVFEFVHRERR
jgi:hypothetical protein